MPRKPKLPDGIKIRNREYHCDFYANGRRVRKYLSGNLEVARQLLNELRARADKAEFGLLDNDFSIDELKTQYLRYCRQTLKPLSAKRNDTSLRMILPQISAARVAQITTENILANRDERLAGGSSPRTVNLEVGTLATMLRWGVRHRIIGRNPIEGLAPLPHDHPKEGRALTVEDVSRLLEASPSPWRDIWYALLVTGLRRGELASLKFGDIDHGSRELLIRSGVAKNHTARRIPIDDGLYAILRAQEQGRAGREPGRGVTPGITAKIRTRFSRDHVFVTTANTPLTHDSSLYDAFIRCCRLAGIETKTPGQDGGAGEHLDVHSLRRTFATTLIVGGADPKSVQELLGHKTLDMTMRIYAKVNIQSKRQALSRLPYGQGSLAPEEAAKYPGDRPTMMSPVQNGHGMANGQGDGVQQSTQVL